MTNDKMDDKFIGYNISIMLLLTSWNIYYFEENSQHELVDWCAY